MTEDRAPSDRKASGSSGRRWWGTIVFLIGVALAIFLIHRTLSRYSAEELAQAVSAIPARNLAGAGLFAALSYLCLTGFDYLALRYAEHPLPWRRAALASFTSLSLGHTIGFAALSSGAIRYRFYSRWGLGAGEVAKVVLFCAVTVGLGLGVLAGLALVFAPDFAADFLGVPQGTVMLVGAALLAAAALYAGIAAFRRGEIAVRGWVLRPPPLRLALAQLVIGPLNFAFVAACLHQTVTAVAEAPYLKVAAAYVVANVSTLITHVPGGLGVIESVVMYLLPQADLIGALLAFRFIYFFAPLALGALLFLTTEIWFRGAAKGSADPASSQLSAARSRS